MKYSNDLNGKQSQQIGFVAQIGSKRRTLSTFGHQFLVLKSIYIWIIWMNFFMKRWVSTMNWRLNVWRNLRHLCSYSLYSDQEIWVSNFTPDILFLIITFHHICREKSISIWAEIWMNKIKLSMVHTCASLSANPVYLEKLKILSFEQTLHNNRRRAGGHVSALPYLSVYMYSLLKDIKQIHNIWKE